ncbi:PIKFYVE (predicted) [Pycnogonum litorale]
MPLRPNSLATVDLHTLTEFDVLTPDGNLEPSGFSLSRFFKRVTKPADREFESSSDSLTRSGSTSTTSNVHRVSQESPGSSKSGSDPKASGLNISSQDLRKTRVSDSKVSDSIDSPSTPSDAHVAFSSSCSSTTKDVVYTRSLTHVLKRIRNILDGRSSTPQAYKDSDFKQYWMPDSNCRECYECGDKFNTFRRRHHCRVCGQIFCRRCCNQEIPGKIMGYTGDLRACTYCCRVVLSYVRSSDVLPSGDLKAIQDDLNSGLGNIDGCQYDSSCSIHESANHSIRSSGSFRRKISTGFREEEFVRTSSRSDLRTFPSLPDMHFSNQISSERKLLTKDSAQLHCLWSQMKHPTDGVEFQNHRLLLRTYQDCVSGNNIVNWLISNDKASSRYQAIAIGQALLDANILETVGRVDDIFVDDCILYHAKQNDKSASQPDISIEFCDGGQEPSWAKDIVPDGEISDVDSVGSREEVNLDANFGTELPKTDGNDNENDDNIPRSYSTFYLDLNIKDNTCYIKRPSDYKIGQRTVDRNGALFENNKGNSTTDEYIAPQGWHHSHLLREENGEKLAYERLQGAYEIHEHSLIRQLLSSCGLSLSWCDTIIPIVHQVTEMVKPDILNDNDDKDIRQYVHLKKVPGGNKSDCLIVSGVVCTKNVVHKKMKVFYENPRILLVCSPIVYQRVENKFSSLEPIIMQECEYLKNVVAKICSYKPDIVMVEKTVSRCAQNMLLNQGITVILNVKRSVMERVSRCTQADIVSSLDAQLGTPQLGICYYFWLRSYTLNNGYVKTLMGFDGCAKHLGCTILLRGATGGELNKVKQITQFMIYVAYNWRLERSFLMDEFAMPSPLPDETPLVLNDGDHVAPRDKLFKGESMRDMHDEELFSHKANQTGKTSKLKSDNKNRTDDEKKDRLQHQSSKDGVNESHLKVEITKKSRRLSLHELSDPLRSVTTPDSNRSKFRKASRIEVAPLPLSNRFRKALGDVVLSCSPNMKYTVPYLESETGRICELIKFFPKEVYWSSQIHKDLLSPNVKPFAEMCEDFSCQYKDIFRNKLPDNVEIQQHHPLIYASLVNNVGSSSLQELLASFRSNGGQIKRLCPHEVNSKKQERKMKLEDESNNLESASSSVAPSYGFSWKRKTDALDPYKHQRLPVLFCSYSYISSNAPNFCVNPWVVSMDFYGGNDITLGEFLERYCFRSTYECPSITCDAPMMDHIRKFAHDDGCIHIVLKKLDKIIPMAMSVILMWSWCHKCHQVTPFAPMSIDTWSLSFAKYLELRFVSSHYGRRAGSHPCGHSLHHDFYQYFGFKDTVASFKYSKITLREITLPSITVGIYDNVLTMTEIIDKIKTLTIKGYSIYSCILEKLCTLREECRGSNYEQVIQKLLSSLSDERSKLRERVEEIQTKLTPEVENKSTFNSEQYDNVHDVDSSFPSSNASIDNSETYWEIVDMSCHLKKIVHDAVLTWNSQIQNFIINKRKDDKAAKRLLLSVSSQSSLTAADSAGISNSPDILNSTVSSQFSRNSSISTEMEIVNQRIVANLERIDVEVPMTQPGVKADDYSVDSLVGEENIVVAAVMSMDPDYRDQDDDKSRFDEVDESVKRCDAVFDTEGIASEKTFLKSCVDDGDGRGTVDETLSCEKVDEVVDTTDGNPSDAEEGKIEKRDADAVVVKIDDLSASVEIEIKDASGDSSFDSDTSSQESVARAKRKLHSRLAPASRESSNISPGIKQMKPSHPKVDAIKGLNKKPKADPAKTSVGNNTSADVGGGKVKRRKIGVVQPAVFPVDKLGDVSCEFAVSSDDEIVCKIPADAQPDDGNVSELDTTSSNVFSAATNDIQSSEPLIDLTETTEECRKTIEALDRLQEEEMRRRRSSLDVSNVRSSSHSSSLNSITISETVGMYVGLLDPDKNVHPDEESFAILHKSQLKNLEVDIPVVDVNRGHGRSKSDGDKCLDSSNLLNSNSDSDVTSHQQSTATSVVSVYMPHSSDKEKKVGGTMKSLLNQLLSGPLSSPVQNPFPLSEHFLFQGSSAATSSRDDSDDADDHNRKIPIVIYDEEPSSVIAYTLASDEYRQELHDLVSNNLFNAQQKDVFSSSPKQRRKNPSKEDSFGENISCNSEMSQNLSKKPNKLTFLRGVTDSFNADRRFIRLPSIGPYDGVQYQVTSRNDSVDLEDDQTFEVNNALSNSQEIDKNQKVKEPIHHVEIQFSDSSANFYCKVYFAEQFRSLRKLIFPAGEERYVRSLSRCRRWKAYGGKSGSIFCKTHDDRFILKQLSRLEVQSFGHFAAHYFKYIHRAANEQRPTVIAKILGVYHIVHRNNQTNTASKLHLLVMENLFYGHTIKQKFDLKGSIRNRLVNTVGNEESDIVLLDENLLKMTCDCPLYVRPHTKTVLNMAIHNDTEFLSSLLVMDYSLLVGLDSDNEQLVIGIIDYIRTFTWDKKLEMVVKAIGSQGKMPTVVSPDSYRTRFCEAMDRYFLMVPDRWHGLGKGVDS